MIFCSQLISYKYFIVIMDASQQIIKYKSKMKKNAKSKPIVKSIDTESTTSNQLNLSNRECEWFSRLCPNFTDTRHIYIKNENEKNTKVS